MATTNKKLHLNFKNASGDKSAVILDDPKQDLTEAEVAASAGQIIASNTLHAKGSAYTDLESAYIREVVTTTLIASD